MSKPALGSVLDGEIEKANVAFHESAHAAVGFALGSTPVEVELIITGGINDDGMHYLTFKGAAKTTERDQARSTLSSVADFATIAAAGPIAELRRCRLFGLPDPSGKVSRGDFANIARAAEWSSADPAKYLQEAQRRATAALDRPEIWRGICDLARTLRWPTSECVGVHTEVMPSDEVEAVLRRAGVKPRGT